jgi:sigma54-dependent transcription regulator
MLDVELLKEATLDRALDPGSQSSLVRRTGSLIKFGTNIDDTFARFAPHFDYKFSGMFVNLREQVTLVAQLRARGQSQTSSLDDQAMFLAAAANAAIALYEQLRKSADEVVSTDEHMRRLNDRMQRSMSSANGPQH